MDLPELLFGMALLLALAVPALWWAVPVLLLGYAFVSKAETVANDVRDTSPPGDGFALWGGIFTIAAAGVVVVAVLLAVGSVAGAI